jgi:DNA end-binding protein Ku
MARAIWKGVIGFGPIEVPVKLLSAVEQGGVHFRLLHEKDRTPVEQHMINPVTGEIVPNERIRRGFEIEPGTFVPIGDEEADAVAPDDSRAIEVLRFVASDRIDPQWFERPYYLAPDNGARAYAALAQALADRDAEGVVRWTMRKKSHVGALRSDGEHLMLIELHHSDEVVPVASLRTPASHEPSKRELDMARQLVDAFEGEFDPAQFRDEFRDRVLDLVKKKAAGKHVAKPKKKAAKRAPSSISSALEASLKAARKEKSDAAA